MVHLNIIIPAYWYTTFDVHFLLSKNISSKNTSIHSSRAATILSSMTKDTRDILCSTQFVLNTKIPEIAPISCF